MARRRRYTLPAHLVGMRIRVVYHIDEVIITPKAVVLPTSLAVLVAVVIVVVISVGKKPVHHSVTLTWHPPTPVKGVKVVSYNVYRSVAPGGPYVRIASDVTSPLHHDTLVNNTRTYYYVVTALDAAGHESGYSAETHANIP